MALMENLKRQARALKSETLALYLAARDPRVPWYAKVLAAMIVAYDLSPIDLIPDPIPVLGYLDDLVLIPLGVLLVRRMIPPAVLAESRERVDAGAVPGARVGWVAPAVIVVLWAVAAAGVVWGVVAWWVSG